MTHPVVRQLLAAIPEVSVRRAAIVNRGEYRQSEHTILIRHGLRGPAWLSTIVHEALHAHRGDVCGSDSVVTERQEMCVRRDAARLLVDIRELAEAAAAHPDDPHLVAELLGVDHDTLMTRLRHLHPAERHFLHRRLAHTEESA